MLLLVFLIIVPLWVGYGEAVPQWARYGLVFLLGYESYDLIQAVWRPLWRRINQKLDEWADV